MPHPSFSRVQRGAALAAVLVAASLPAPAVDADGGSPLARLRWLAGCWASEIDEPGSGEQWMAPAGGTMFGVARTVKGGRTVQHEFMQLRESAAGTVVFVAQPGGRPGASFTSVELGETGAVFENPGTDFPQRVIYRLRPDGRLAARIEGQRNGEPRGVDFPMKRAPCGG